MKLSPAQNRIMMLLNDQTNGYNTLLEGFASGSWYGPKYIKELNGIIFSSEWSGTAIAKTLAVLVNKGLVTVEKVNYDTVYNKPLNVNNVHDSTRILLSVKIVPINEGRLYGFNYLVKKA